MCPGEIVLEDILNNVNCKGIALVARDGSTLSSNLGDEVSIDTFAIMSATMLGAADTASKEIGQMKMKRVTVKNEDGGMVIYPAGRRNLLVLVFDTIPDGIDEIVGPQMEMLASL